MRVLVVGHRGMLGQDLMRALDGRYALGGADCDELDIREIESVRECLKRHKPEVVINAAAYTNVDGAESEEALARDVNAKGAGNIAKAAREMGIKTVHLSTDYVFDGRKAGPYFEDDPTGPISAYGRSKLEGEREVFEADPKALIVRTAWLYGRSGKNFVETIIKLAGERDRLTVVDDQRGSPTWTMHLAQGISQLVRAGATGIVHATNSGATTWYKFALKIIESAGKKGVRVEPITSDKLDRPAKRPSNSVLDGSKFTRLTGAPMPSWEEGLKRYMIDRSESRSRP